MLSLALLVPALTFHTFAVAAVVICAAVIVFWFLRKASIPEPFNYIVYLLMALVALWFVFWLLNNV